MDFLSTILENAVGLFADVVDHVGTIPTDELIQSANDLVRSTTGSNVQLNSANIADQLGSVITIVEGYQSKAMAQEIRDGYPDINAAGLPSIIVNAANARTSLGETPIEPPAMDRRNTSDYDVFDRVGSELFVEDRLNTGIALNAVYNMVSIVSPGVKAHYPVVSTGAKGVYMHHEGLLPMARFYHAAATNTTIFAVDIVKSACNYTIMSKQGNAYLTSVDAAGVSYPGIDAGLNISYSQYRNGALLGAAASVPTGATSYAQTFKCAKGDRIVCTAQNVAVATTEFQFLISGHKDTASHSDLKEVGSASYYAHLQNTINLRPAVYGEIVRKVTGLLDLYAPNSAASLPTVPMLIMDNSDYAGLSTELKNALQNNSTSRAEILLQLEQVAGLR